MCRFGGKLIALEGPRMWTWRIILGSAALCLSIGLRSGHAENADDVQALYQKCKNENSAENLVCLGFIAGVANTMHLLAADGDHKRPDLEAFSMCGSPSYGAMTQTFMNWAEKHPEHWGMVQVGGVVIALHEKWPCQ